MLYALAVDGGDGRATYVSDNVTHITGFSVEEALAPGWWLDRLHPDDAGRVLSRLPELDRGDLLVDEYRFLRRDGTHLWVRDERRRSVEPGTGTVEIVGAWTDITEASRVVEALDQAMTSLRDSEARYRALFEANPHPMWVYDLETLRFLAVNDASIAHYGYSRDEFLSMTIADIRPAEDLPRLRESLSNAPPGLEVSGLWRHVTKDGREIDVEIISHTLQFDRRPAKSVLANDVTSRLQNETMLRKLSQAVEQSPVSIVITDAAGAIEYANSNFTRVTGYSLDEVRGQNPRILSSGDVSPETYRDLWETITTGGEWHGLFHNRKKDGTRFVERAAVSPIHDAAGRLTHFVAVKEDITAQLALEEQLRQSQKLEAVGRLAGGIAHDFNNMLSVVLGFTELAQQRVGSSGPVYEDLEEVRRAAERSASLVSQLLAFARRQIVEPVAVDLHERLSGSRKMLERLVGEDIDVSFVSAPDLWVVRIDPGQLDQVLANLVVNARDAVPGPGHIAIETDNVVVDAAYAQQHPDAVPGEYVLLAVSDSGVGMSADVQAQVFDPFFTTKPPGKGTGLGLPTVYGIVRQHGGFINVYSEAGHGTTFRLYLPRFHGPTEARREASPVGLPTGHETLLLVEDNRALLALMASLLEQRGYRVLAASLPDEALARCDAHDGPIDLLVTDVVLPQMSGRQLKEEVSRRRPSIKVLYMSGYTADIIGARGVLPEDSHFLQKPVAAARLARKVREVLDGAFRMNPSPEANDRTSSGTAS